MPFLRRRNRGNDTSILPIVGKYHEARRIGRPKQKTWSILVKCVLIFGLFALKIMYRNRSMIKPRLRSMKRMHQHPDWRKWSREKFKTQFECDYHLRLGTTSVPKIEYWQTLRDVYKSEVDSSYLFDDPIPPTQGSTLNENGATPYYADLSPGKGRGLFASRDIMKGELVDGVEGGTKSDMKFTTEEAMQRYLMALPEPMACDVMEWTYTADLGMGEKPVILCASDISSLMNTVRGNDQANVMPKDSSSSTLLFAVRDIKKGEEILMDYEVFPAGLW